jgi:hypothetical protein
MGELDLADARGGQVRAAMAAPAVVWQIAG